METPQPFEHIAPRHQVVCGNAWRIQMYFLCTHGPGILLGAAAPNGTVAQVTYVTHSAAADAVPAALANHPDALQALRSYAPLTERLLLIRDAEATTLVRVPLSFGEEVMASAMLAARQGRMPFPPPDPAALLAWQQSYTPARWRRQVRQKRPGERPPLQPRPQAGAALRPTDTVFQGRESTVALLVMTLGIAAFRRHAEACFRTHGRGFFFVVVEAGWQIPWFLETCDYLPAAALETWPSLPETAEGDRDLAEMVRTYDPQTQAVVVVIKPDAAPSRVMAIHYLTPDADTRSPAERQRVEQTMFQQMQGLPPDLLAVLDRGDEAELQQMLQRIGAGAPVQAAGAPAQTGAPQELPPGNMGVLSDTAFFRVILAVFPPHQDWIGAITHFKEAGVLVGADAISGPLLPPLPAGWDRIGLMGSPSARVVEQGQRANLTVMNTQDGMWLCACDWDTARGRCADVFLQAQDAIHPQKMSLDPRLILPLLLLTHIPDMRPGTPGYPTDTVRWLLVLDDLQAVLLPLLEQCFTAWLDGPSAHARHYARQTGRTRGTYRLGHHPEGQFVRLLVGDAAVQALVATERIEPAILRLLRTTSAQMWREPQTIGVVRRALAGRLGRDLCALAAALLTIALWQPADTAPAVLPAGSEPADAAVIRQLWAQHTASG